MNALSSAPAPRLRQPNLHNELQHECIANSISNGESTQLRRKRGQKQQQHPEWRLDDEEEWNLANFHGSVLDVSYSMLPNLRPVWAAPSFKNLNALSLRDTGLVKIELLRSCAMLVHLDLSSNEIVDLVGDDFWASFPDLLILLLHGNKVTDWRAAGSLGKAPRLAYLTLFFNPICKRKSYRIFMVNCCESLRGLDLHVVSDEEVIEGSHFFRTSRYRSCSSALALPQPLFKGLTEITHTPNQDEQTETSSQLSPSPCTSNAVGYQAKIFPYDDAYILAGVVRRVRLLQRFHARNSPVIIGQRQIRRYARHKARLIAAVSIQKSVRSWRVRLRAVRALKDILQGTGELYLIQETITPAQLRSLICFQRQIHGHFRVRVLLSCVHTLERFVCRVRKRFSSFIACIDRAQVGGVVVSSDKSGDLAAAVAKALIATAPAISREEATAQAVTMVTIVPNCRLVSQFSYVDVLDWPFLQEDVITDGVFITRSASGSRPVSGRADVCSSRLLEASIHVPPQPVSGLVERLPRARRRMGLFGSERVRAFSVSCRGVVVRRLYQNRLEGGDTPPARVSPHEKLWVFRPGQAHMLARVLCILRTGSPGTAPVPYILEKYMLRCAAATRVQAAWRGHVLRWNLLETLASCLIVARAAVCIQRWWRTLTGLGARLRLCRRLWALASAVCCRTMYMEIDVYFTLTRGWRWGNGRPGIAYTFTSGGRIASVSETANEFLDPPPRTIDVGANLDKKKWYGKTPGVRELPMWTFRGLVPKVVPSEVCGRPILRQASPILTEGVKAKRVVWPLAAAPDNPLAPGGDGTACGSAILTSAHTASHRTVSLESASTEIWGGTSRSELSTKPSLEGTDSYSWVDSGPPINLGASHGEIEMLELTFSSAAEARARAVLLALATEEPGVASNQPVAQLMTMGMLRKAAAGEPGRAVSTLRPSTMGYERGDSVEMYVLKFSEGKSGTWCPGKIDRKNGNGRFKVTLDNGWVEPYALPSCLRPHDPTGKDPALVSMSHLPSRWQHHARSLLTPADRLELELFRRSLDSTTPAELAVERPVHLLSGAPPQADSPCFPRPEDTSRVEGIALGDLESFRGVGGRGLTPGLRSRSPGSPPNRDGVRRSTPSPRWAGSQTVAAARAGGQKTTWALEVAEKATAAADEAATATPWVPGNRFRRDLERLVSLAARESRGAAVEKELSARRDIVMRARNTEHLEPTPRDRLERLKAAEVAVFRRESDELRHKAAVEKAVETVERSSNVAEAREFARGGAKLTKSCMEARRSKHVSDARRWEEEVEEERLREEERQQGDVRMAKVRASQRRAERVKQALCRAESSAFTANASELSRHLGKHATKCRKAQSAGGMQRWIKGEKAHKDEMRRRMLRRVQELQEQKRMEAAKQRKALSARRRARGMLDDAILRHRLGQPTPSENDFTSDAMQVLRPNSRAHDPNQWQVEAVGGVDGLGSGYHDLLQQRPSSSGIETERGRLQAAGSRKGCSVDANGAGVVPSKPEGSRPRSREQRNRRLRVNGGGKTVVVLASVPTVAAEMRTRRSAADAGPLFTSKSSHSVLSTSLQHNTGSTLPFSSAPAQALLPWPMGRRCW